MKVKGRVGEVSIEVDNVGRSRVVVEVELDGVDFSVANTFGKGNRVALELVGGEDRVMGVDRAVDGSEGAITVAVREEGGQEEIVGHLTGRDLDQAAEELDGAIEAVAGPDPGPGEPREGA